MRNERENARVGDAFGQAYSQNSRVALSSEVDTVTAKDTASRDRLADSSHSQRQAKRVVPDSSNVPKPKRARMVVSRESSEDEQMENIASVLRSLEEEFAKKERL